MFRYASDALQTKARRQLWSYAFFRLESALLIGSSIVLLGLSLLGTSWLPGSWPVWLGLGVAAEAALVGSTVSDKALQRRFLDEQFKQQFELTKLRSLELRNKVEAASKYRGQILEVIERKEGSFDDDLYRLVQDLESWVAQIYDLALHLDAYDQDRVLAQDIEQAPQDLKALKDKLSSASGQRIQAQVQTALDAKTQQWQALQNLRDSMEGARLQLGSTLAAMSTLYSQIINLNTRELEAGRAQDLQRDMREQVQSLKDMTSAVDEIYKLSS